MDAGEIHAHAVAAHPQFLGAARRIRQRDRRPRRMIHSPGRPEPQLFLKRVRKQHPLGDFPHFRHGANMMRRRNFARPESGNFLVISPAA